VGTLVLLFSAPLALGAVHEPAFVPLLVVASLIGLLSWGRGHWVRSNGGELPAVPGERLLLALHAVVLLQLLPLPPTLLRIVSRGSFQFYDSASLLSLSEWRPVSVNPADTARGFAFLAGMSLLYGAVFREFRDETWRRRLAGTVVATGSIMTIAALVQAASPHPTTIYGLWKPRWDWGVFGPYVSRNHFAGYLAMAIPLAIGFTMEAALSLRRDWSRRISRRWVALGGPAGNAVLRRLAAATVLVVGLFASHSRGGLLAFAVSALAILFALPRARGAALVFLVAIVLVGVGVIDLGITRKGFADRGVKSSRTEMWRDALRMYPDFPLLGAGFNAFGTSYTGYQSVARYQWYGEAHNEYLQALLDTGTVGALLVVALVVRLLRSALRAAAMSPLDAGLLGALLACCAHNLVDFNWQIPANAATFAAIAGVAVRRAADMAALAELPPPRS
jgi:O-antigen ligase